jgi:hypothetical protein
VRKDTNDEVDNFVEYYILVLIYTYTPAEARVNERSEAIMVIPPPCRPSPWRSVPCADLKTHSNLCFV